MNDNIHDARSKTISIVRYCTTEINRVTRVPSHAETTY
jgi:hypothetical protein